MTYKLIFPLESMTYKVVNLKCYPDCYPECYPKKEPNITKDDRKQSHLSKASIICVDGFVSKKDFLSLWVCQ